MLPDLEKVTPSLPDAALTIKPSLVTAKYKGTAKVEETDKEPHRAVIEANGKDARGQGTASAATTPTLHEEDSGTRVRIETGMRLTGRLVQFARSIQQDLAEKIMDQFSDCLKKELF